MIRVAVPVFLVVSILAACHSTGARVDPRMQSVVEDIARENANITRLSVHAKPDGADQLHAIASTSADKRGALSDPEDVRAIQSGEVVVIDEGPGIDVTVPILRSNGSYLAAAGVTLSDAAGDRDAAIATARSIAGRLEAAMRR